MYINLDSGTANPDLENTASLLGGLDSFSSLNKVKDQEHVLIGALEGRGITATRDSAEKYLTSLTDIEDGEASLDQIRYVKIFTEALAEAEEQIERYTNEKTEGRVKDFSIVSQAPFVRLLTEEILDEMVDQGIDSPNDDNDAIFTLFLRAQRTGLITRYALADIELNALKKEMKQKEIEHQEALKNLSTSHSDKMIAMESKAKQALLEAKAEYEQKQSEATQQHESTVQALKSQIEEQQKELDKTSEKLQEKTEKLRDAESEVRASKEALTFIKETTSESQKLLADSAQKEREALESRLNEATSRYERAEQAHAKAEEAHAKAEGKAEGLQKQLDEERKKHEADIQSLKDQHQAELQGLQSSHQEAIANVQAEAKKAIEDKDAAHQKEVESLESQIASNRQKEQKLLEEKKSEKERADKAEREAKDQAKRADKAESDVREKDAQLQQSEAKAASLTSQLEKASSVGQKLLGEKEQAEAATKAQEERADKAEREAKAHKERADKAESDKNAVKGELSRLHAAVGGSDTESSIQLITSGSETQQDLSGRVDALVQENSALKVDNEKLHTSNTNLESKNSLLEKQIKELKAALEKAQTDQKAEKERADKAESESEAHKERADKAEGDLKTCTEANANMYQSQRLVAVDNILDRAISHLKKRQIERPSQKNADRLKKAQMVKAAPDHVREEQAIKNALVTPQQIDTEQSKLGFLPAGADPLAIGGTSSETQYIGSGK